jgi:hypothetical protein
LIRKETISIRLPPIAPAAASTRNALADVTKWTPRFGRWSIQRRISYRKGTVAR